MKIPINCDLFINDCIIDPQDWTNLIHFTNPNIHICRSFGIHAKTIAPKAFFTRAANHLTDLANNYPVGAYGPFGLLKSPNTSDSSPDFSKFISGHQNIKNNQDIPIIISNTESDSQAHAILKQYELNSPIIWQNINNTSIDRFINFTKTILPTNNQYLFTINGRCLEYKYANQIQHIIRDKSILNQLLLGTDCPQYAANYTRQLHSHPLHIANMTLELHLILIKSNAFKHYTLADTNDLLTNNAFSVFPRKLFNNLNVRSFENYTKKTIATTLNEYKSLIGYSSTQQQQKTPIKTKPATKRPADETSIEHTTPAAKKQCYDAAIQTTQTLKSRDVTTSTPSQTQSSSATNTQSESDSDDIIILTHSEHSTDIPATQAYPAAANQPTQSSQSTQSPQLAKPTQPTKSTSSSPVKSKIRAYIEKENNAKASIIKDLNDPRRRKIINKAFEVCYGDFSDPEHPSWSTNDSGSRIQVLRPPLKLIQSMTKQSEKLNDEELDKFLSKFPTPKYKRNSSTE